MLPFTFYSLAITRGRVERGRPLSLDLNNTALQIDSMALHLKARQGEHEQRLRNAMAAIDQLTTNGLDGLLSGGEDDLEWAVPRLLEGPSARYPAPSEPADFCVVAADGSHIGVDRHMPARCFLINTGVAALTYGSRPDADLRNQPRLYARDDELVIRDVETSMEQLIEGTVLGAMRTVEEIRALADAVRGLPADTPTLALLDGSLMMLGLVGQGFHDFVLRELIEEGFVAALNGLRELAQHRTLAVASYISLPGHAEVVRALRGAVCGYDSDDRRRGCRLVGPGPKPCDRCVGGVRDREVFARLLESGDRSAMFATSSRVVSNHYGDTGVHFFYANVGEEVARVEMPSWVAEDKSALGLVHALLVDQCVRGDGYPVALMEAHEQAVVAGPDRRLFVELVEGALHSQRLPVFTSEKDRSKRLRSL